MERLETALPGVLLLKPKRFGDARGFFAETWNRNTMEGIGIDIEFVQDNHSVSEKAGTIRGLHFQAPPHAQDKLIRCGHGAFLDVAVDIRKASPTFGKWVGVELSAENGYQLLVPKGFAHGFVTRQPGTEICYKCSDFYSPEAEGAINFADPEIGIDWGIDPIDAIASDKDRSAPLLADLDSPFGYLE